MMYPDEFLTAYHLDLEVGVAEIKNMEMCGGYQIHIFAWGKNP